MKSIIYITPFVILTLMLVTASATTAIGVSFPKVVPSHVTLFLNDSTTVAFSFTLYNGTAGTTCIGIPDSTQLQANGTYTNVVPSSGIPPFNGTMGITTKSNAVPGNYTVQLAGGCADPTTHGIAVVYLTVLNAQKPITVTTTTPTTTIPSNVPTTTTPVTTPTTIVPTTSVYVAPPPHSANSTVIYILVAIVIIAIIAIIVAFYKMRHKY